MKNTIEKINKIESNEIKAIINELEEIEEVMDLIRGSSLRGGDFLESLASTLHYYGEVTEKDLNESISLSK